jgi:signal transduction histidine kinase
MKHRAVLGGVAAEPQRLQSSIIRRPKLLGTDGETAGRDEFLANVAHELKTPLNVILLTAARLLEEQDPPGAPPRDRRALESIARSAHRMRRLVADLLDSAALDAGALTLRPGLAPLRPVIAEAIDAQGVLSRAAGVELVATIAPDLPPVWMDGWRILQVLDNLISNAVKFTPHGGRVRVVATAEGPLVTVAVSDSGPGLDEEELSRLFDRFWRSGRTSAPGHGIGLAVCRSILAQSGQRIWAKSRPGHGTTVSFTLATQAPV